MNRRSYALLGAAVAMLAGCGGGGGGGSMPSAPASPPAPLTVSAASLSINALGAHQQLAVTENGYSGVFSLDVTACAPHASVDALSLNGPQATFTFTGTGVGTCTASVSDSHGQKQSLAITVTSTSGSLQ